VSSLVIINGEEEFLKERMARDYVVSSLSDEILDFHFPKDQSSYLEHSQSFFFEKAKRSFIVWGSKHVPPLPVGEDDVLIVVSLGKTKLSDKRARKVLETPKFKASKFKNDYVRWIVDEGERRKIDLRRVAGALFVNHGTCLRKIASEIEKLSVIADSETTITPDMAKSVLSTSAEFDPLFLVSSVSDGNTPRTLAAFDRMQETGNPNGRIIAYMIRHVLEMLKLEKSSPGSSVRSSARQDMLDNLKKWSVDSLSYSVIALRDLDIRNKQGDPSVAFALEAELIRLSEEVKNGHVRHSN
jgi:DNA polymerase III delta subunit